MNKGVEMQKIDYTNKHDIMVGYIDRSQNICAVQTGWKTTPEEMAKILDRKYPTKEDSIKVVDSPVLIPTFRKEDYWGVEGFGDVIESNLSWNKEVMRKKVGHLFCHMTGVWKYSDNGIDWTPIREEFAEEFKEVA
jgi:hypothetical protein|tara:strand:+ start:467 stop:874 length:408 start_codon:yes stop_codon:yes gene_type:complete